MPENTDAKRAEQAPAVSENNTQGSSNEQPASPQREGFSSPAKVSPDLEKAKSMPLTPQQAPSSELESVKLKAV